MSLGALILVPKGSQAGGSLCRDMESGLTMALHELGLMKDNLHTVKFTLYSIVEFGQKYFSRMSHIWNHTVSSLASLSAFIQLRGSSTLLYGSVVCSFSLPSSTPLYQFVYPFVS